MAERMAINAPIQGTATADIIKIGMKNADDKIKELGFSDKAELVLQVHDELIYEVEENIKDIIIEELSFVFKNVIPVEFLEDKNSVPLEVSVAVGKRWGDLK